MSTGLILVDIQNDYFAGGRMELAGMDAAGEKAGELLTFFVTSGGRRFISSTFRIMKAQLFFYRTQKGQRFILPLSPVRMSR
jgi:nicotinamidase-related amidase